MNNTKTILSVIGFITGMTSAFIIGRKSAEKQAEEEIEWFNHQLEESDDDNNFLREQLTKANEEICRLRNSGKNSK